jgi:uncharacterized protein YbjT (DUF2867 family)
MRILFAGASGMVGGELLRHCLEHEQIQEVVSLVRKPGVVSHPRLREVVVPDFYDLSSQAPVFQGIDLCFYCIGVYVGQVPAAEFRKITEEGSRVFIEALFAGSSGCRVVYLSGMGADSTETSRMLFPSSKGKAENLFLKRGFRSAYVVRPGYIYPDTPRKEPNFFYVVSRWGYLYLARFLYPNIGIRSGQLARAMLRVGFDGYERPILENADLRKLARF